jgi:hypothetical protein
VRIKMDTFTVVETVIAAPAAREAAGARLAASFSQEVDTLVAATLAPEGVGTRIDVQA